MQNQRTQLFQSFFFILFIAGFLSGQNISGVVYDQDGSPLAGANVIVERGNIGAATDLNGAFSFSFVPKKDFILAVSYIGYQTDRRSMRIDDPLTGLEFTLIQGNLFGQEVTVMARKKEEKIKDVPISMVAIRKETIEDMGATSIEDLTVMVPNVFVREDAAVEDFNIRGIDGGARNPGMATTEGVYIDGIVMGRPDFIALDIVDMESVEFLRGPQGTLFGRNTISGAINMISVKPKPGRSGSVLVESGNSGHQKIKASINFQFTDKIYQRLSVSSFDLTAHQTNAGKQIMGINDTTYVNSPNKYKDNIGIRYSLRALPSPKLTIDFSYDHFSQKNTQQGNHVSDWHFNSDFSRYHRAPLDSLIKELYLIYPDDMKYLAHSNGDITDDGIFSYNHNTLGKSERVANGLTLNFIYQITDEFNLVGLFGYRKGIHDYENDEDGIGLDLLTGTWKARGEQSSAELRLESSSSKRLSWMAGLYYYNLYESLDEPVFPKPLFFHIYAGIPMFLARNYDGVTVHPDGAVATASVGAFASADYKVNEKLTVTAGTRYSYDNKALRYQQDGLPTFGYIHFPPDTNNDNLPDGYFDSTAHWSAVTPSLSIKYAVSPLTNVYTTISKGYKSGGFNLDYVSSWESAAIPFKPEFITNYELGLKIGNRMNTMYLNTAIFYMDYINMQRAIFQDLYEGYTISNAASATMKGLETELTVRLFKNSLTIMGGFGLTDAIFNVFRDGYFNGYFDEGEQTVDAGTAGALCENCTETGTPADSSFYFIDEDTDFSGQTIAAFPKYSWNLMADLRLPISSSIMFVSQVQADFMDEKQSQLSSTDAFNQLRDDARTLVSARVGIEMGPWSIFAWADNLFNVEYISWTGENGYIGVLEQDYGLPRRMGIRTAYKF